MTATRKDIDRIVVARTAQDAFAGVGRMIAHADEPTITFVNPDGSQTHWLASLCNPVDLPSEVVDALLPQYEVHWTRRGGRPRETKRDVLLVTLLQEPGASYQSVADAYNCLHPPAGGKRALSSEAVRKVAKASQNTGKAT